MMHEGRRRPQSGAELFGERLAISNPRLTRTVDKIDIFCDTCKKETKHEVVTIKHHQTETCTRCGNRGERDV